MPSAWGNSWGDSWGDSWGGSEEGGSEPGVAVVLMRFSIASVSIRFSVA